MESRLMPEIPVLRLEPTQPFSATPPPAAHSSFYHAADLELQDDLSTRIVAEMPQFTRALFAQFALVADIARAVASGESALKELADQAHAVKSAALSLGYFRLSGLMDGAEHAARTHAFAALPGNWLVIAEVTEAATQEGALADAFSTITGDEAGFQCMPENAAEIRAAEHNV